MKRSASSCLSPARSKESELVEQHRKVPKTSVGQHPSKGENSEAGEMLEGHATVQTPLNPLTVNDCQAKTIAQENMQIQPSAREIAAAKAARIRLGYEKDEEATVDVLAPAPKVPSGPEPTKEVDVEYILTKDLKPLDDASATKQELFQSFTSKNWTEWCKALNDARRLTVHHTEDAKEILEKLVPAVLRLVRNPRSSVCKSAVMACSDFLSTFGDDILPFLDGGGPTKPVTSLLCQLLLKASSNEKQFVRDEVQNALTTMSQCITPGGAIEKLIPYTKHRNPKVRGKAGFVLALFAGKMESGDLHEFGMAKMIQIAGKLLTDNTPDAREAARKLILIVKSAIDALEESKAANGESGVVEKADENKVDVNEKGEGSQQEAGENLNKQLGESAEVAQEKEAKQSPWEEFCFAHLNALTAASVLKSSNGQ